jgi:hypothetical protein
MVRRTLDRAAYMVATNQKQGAKPRFSSLIRCAGQYRVITARPWNKAVPTYMGRNDNSGTNNNDIDAGFFCGSG